MWTDQNDLAMSYKISERYWSTEPDPDAWDALIGIRQTCLVWRIPFVKPHSCVLRSLKYHGSILSSYGWSCSLVYSVEWGRV